MWWQKPTKLIGLLLVVVFPFDGWAIGGGSKPRKPSELNAALQDGDPEVRRKAARDAGRFGDASTVPHLIRGLDDKSAAVQIRAIESLGHLGPVAAASEAKLLTLLRGEDPKWRRLAAETC